MMRGRLKLPAPGFQPWPVREESRASSDHASDPTITADGAFVRSNFPKSSMAIESLDVIEQGHEAKVHMQLLMAVEQSEPGIISCKIQFHFLISAEHCYVFQHAGRGNSGDARELKTVAVEMDGMNVVTCVAQANTVALALLQMK